jgi:hypothetical protein
MNLLLSVTNLTSNEVSYSKPRNKMTQSRHIILFLFGLFFVLEASAQHKKGHAHYTQLRTAYYISFTGAKSLADVQQLSDSIYAMKYVDGFKARFKPENNLGEIIVVAVIKAKVFDRYTDFDDGRVKKILDDYGFVFEDISVVQLSNEEKEE